MSGRRMIKSLPGRRGSRRCCQDDMNVKPQRHAQIADCPGERAFARLCQVSYLKSDSGEVSSVSKKS